jgi:hypothetical protein
MAFLARLDDAKESVNKEFKLLSPSPVKLKRPTVESESKSPSEVQVQQAKSIFEEIQQEYPFYRIGGEESDEENNGEKRQNIVWKVCEYLFDLFDANQLEGYKKIEEFEDKAIKSFMKNDYEDEKFEWQDFNSNYDPTLEAKVCEYSFEHQQLHNEFMKLFESIIEEFLEQEGYNIDSFYEILNKTLKESKSNPKSRIEEANEILEVIMCYSSFESWSCSMNEQAKRRWNYLRWAKISAAEEEKEREKDSISTEPMRSPRYKSLTEALEAIETKLINSKNASRPHRLDAECK